MWRRRRPTGGGVGSCMLLGTSAVGAGGAPAARTATRLARGRGPRRCSRGAAGAARRKVAAQCDAVQCASCRTKAAPRCDRVAPRCCRRRPPPGRPAEPRGGRAIAICGGGAAYRGDGPRGAAPKKRTTRARAAALPRATAPAPPSGALLVPRLVFHAHESWRWSGGDCGPRGGRPPKRLPPPTYDGVHKPGGCRGWPPAGAVSLVGLDCRRGAAPPGWAAVSDGARPAPHRRGEVGGVDPPRTAWPATRRRRASAGCSRRACAAARA
eukprot:scaffold2114_cov309-Prasinococcus_capsulatus_cf.AAC.4